MNAGVMYIATAHFVGQLMGYAFAYFKKPVALGAVYLAGRNHSALTDLGSTVGTYLKSLFI